MFGSGSTPSFGGFGSSTPTQTPFNSSAFNKPAGTAFGSTAFGAPASGAAGGSVFGASSTPAFGAPAATPAFGAAATPSTGFGGFGAAASSAPSMFGAPRTQAPLFGSAGTGSFGAPAATQPAKTGFSFGSGTSVFGAQPQPATGTATMFGAQPTGQTPAFGATAPAFGATTGAAMTGTTLKFNAPTGTDTMVKNNTQQHINTRFMCIVTMKEYETKSLEELRMEDYAANRKGTRILGAKRGPQAGAGGFGQPAAGGLFGSTVSSAGSTVFGATQSKPLFGAAPTAAAGGGLFGATQQPAAGGGLFGAKPTAFGTPTTSATGFTGFGQPASSTGGGLFGAANKPLFGAPASSSSGLFGATTQPATGFGAPLTSQPSTGLFGSTPASTGGFSFGGAATQPAASQPATGGLFGAKPAGFTGFGQTQPAAGGFSFGGTAAKPAGSTAFSFNTGSTFGTGTGSLFGNQAKPAAPTFGGFGTAAPNPSLNLYVYTGASVSRQDVLKPTNPQAQKVITEATPYKVSPRLVSKLTPKPITPGKTSLFDGLDDDTEDAAEILVPRRRIKKLDIKAVKGGHVRYAGTRRVPGAGAAAAAAAFLGRHPGHASGAQLGSVSTEAPPLNRGAGGRRARGPKSRVTFAEYGDSPDIIRGQLKTPQLPGTQSQDADDTISSLNPRRAPAAARHAAEAAENKENVSESFILDETVSDDDADVAVPDDADEGPSHPAGVRLRRPGYYTIPPLEELTPAADGSLAVEGLTIGRDGYGSVYFPGETQLAGLDLDAIVVFRRREICIYPDDALKPPLGQGLNKPAQVTLERVWPTDKASREPIRDPARLQRMGWENRLERACFKLGASFVEYRPETGSWVFKVEHFSKYGLNDSDDEEDAVPAGKEAAARALAAGAAPPPAPQRGGGPPPAPPTSGPLERLEAVSALPQPTPPAAAAAPPLAGATALEPSELASPAVRLARSFAVDSEKVQDMKASFFVEEDEGIEDDGGSQLGEEAAGAGLVSAFRPGLLSEMPRGPLAARSASQRPTPLGPSPDLVSEQDDWDERDPPAIGTGGGREQDDWDERDPPAIGVKSRHWEALPTEPATSDRAMVKDCRVLESQAHRELAPIVPRWVGHLTPLESSARASHGQQLADLGSMMGCRWRLGWGPGWRLVAAAGAGAADPFQLVEGRVTAEPVYQDMDTTASELESLVAVQLRFSECSLAEHTVWPLFSTRADLALPEALAKADGQWPDVWELVVALWGRLDFDLPAEDEAECRAYSELQCRREALSRWLETTCRPAATAEINLHTSQQYLETVFAHLTVRQVWEAVAVAQKHRDLRLSLLLTQVMGSHEARQLVRSQLENWRQVGADRHICPLRLRLYMLVAGVAVWQTSAGDVINCCDGLDWRRALAVHLWYLSPATSSVSDVVAQYDEARRVTDDLPPLAPPPLPAYISDHGDSGPEAPRDVCHHLLRLYCSGEGRLEELLAPASHTAQPLDHRLSWLLMECLGSLGYRQLSEESVELLHTNLAAQLESAGLWYLAAFVLLHIDNLDRRRAAISDLLLRHVTLDLSSEVRDRLVTNFGIPVPVLSYAQAVRARALGRRRDEARLLLLAERWQEGHDLLVQHIAPECIINEEYGVLSDLLSRLSPPAVSARVSGWAGAGQVYVDYIAVSRAVQAALEGRADAEQLQRLRPQLASVSRGIAAFSCPTATHRLAQAEMAKKAAVLLRALLDTGRDGGAGVGATLLGHLAKLPLPEDYALDELQHVLKSYLLELSV
ncbi:Nuclear pore complex protein Nup98-Nup96 [Amphibalanus amphitrite]|uniref:Nuclear pore complex protein Nup98-Nup96 n=1 Tax=Amphibalanus amphitrite TaxID=1232801 RepID=A0A6A4X8F9_AMPAM|nr:Nuclear pore complex protein Nup98-Nup96 [Amphibalanus amphitrite]KAF0310691.1 Nuclear pore complex protein Nup98-Nup96 [Amphibalanus amphitrite]